jgi:5-methylcytosine-specific restriction endonuclease McrA
MTLPYQHLEAPTVDHIVPLDAGGDDTRANVQLAHRRCNSQKGNRGGGEQLRLVG